MFSGRQLKNSNNQTVPISRGIWKQIQLYTVSQSTEWPHIPLLWEDIDVIKYHNGVNVGAFNCCYIHFFGIVFFDLCGQRTDKV